MHSIDWSIVIVFLCVLLAIALVTKMLMRSVADYLAAGRSARRYLLCAAEDVAGMGAITFIAYFELYYAAGFTALWWGLIMPLIMLSCSVTGWVIYRYRQTRSLTMAEFFEKRYSKNFRIFAGIVAFVAGIINFGIFPAVATRFFVYFCGLPLTVTIAGMAVDTYAVLMAGLLTMSLIMTMSGGQISLLVTDFFQGIFVNITLVVIVIATFFLFDWDQIMATLMTAPRNASLLDPVHISQLKDFNMWYHIMVGFGIVYGYLAWQGSQGFNASAETPHEARMGKMIGTWRLFVQIFLLTILPLCAYAVLHNPAFKDMAEKISLTLNNISTDTTDAVRVQMTVPVALSYILPVGLKGLLCAMMLSAFIGNNNTYLHSWGSIFIQDVVMPFRKKPLKPKTHIILLRCSVFGVGVFIFFFSLLFKQTQYIFLFLFMTGAIFVAGAGSCIIGGLYWKYGNAKAAWAAMFTGIIVALTGCIMSQIDPNFWLNGIQIKTIACLSAILIYVSISLFSRQKMFDLDRLLHRGKYAIQEDKTNEQDEQVSSLSRIMGISKEFTRGDKIIYFSTISWIVLWASTIIIGTIAALVFDISIEVWAKFWKGVVFFSIAFGMFTTIWFSIGGIRDVRFLFKNLISKTRDHTDDGRIHTYLSIPDAKSDVGSDKEHGDLLNAAEESK